MPLNFGFPQNYINYSNSSDVLRRKVDVPRIKFRGFVFAFDFRGERNMKFTIIFLFRRKVMSKQNIVEYKINPHSVIIEWGLVY